MNLEEITWCRSFHFIEEALPKRLLIGIGRPASSLLNSIGGEAPSAESLSLGNGLSLLDFSVARFFKGIATWRRFDNRLRIVTSAARSLVFWYLSGVLLNRIAMSVDLSRIAVLLMGSGKGSRLWPLSTQHRPKQFMPRLQGPNSILQETFKILPSWVLVERVFVSVARGNEHFICDQIPGIPQENIIVQPEDRDTLPILGLAAAVIERAVHNATLLLFATDNLVGDRSSLEIALMESIVCAQAGKNLVSVGIPPKYASTQYGYMELGEQVLFADSANWGVGYIEKPEEAIAQKLVAGGNHCWNSGIFCWDASSFFDACAVHAERHANQFSKLRNSAYHLEGDALFQLFAKIPKVSVDEGLLEHIRESNPDSISHIIVRAEFTWLDLGRFSSLASTLPRDHAGNSRSGNIESVGVTGSVLIAENPYTLFVRDLTDKLVVVNSSGDVLVSDVTRDIEIRLLAGIPIENCLYKRVDDYLTVDLTDAHHNHLGAFARVIDSCGNVLSSNADGIIALLGVSGVYVHVQGQHVSVISRAATNPPSSLASRCQYVHIDEDNESMSLRAAEFLVSVLTSLLDKKERPSIILSAGKTPRALYSILRSRYVDSLPWSRLDLYQMDEYVGLAPDDPRSFRSFLVRELVEPLGMRGVYLSGALSHSEICTFEDDVKTSGLDLVLHGIGRNGHLGFNEPSHMEWNRARRVTLSASTRAAAADEFSGLDNVPKEGVTLGLDLLSSAQHVMVLASGSMKCSAIRQALLTNDPCPASTIRKHQNKHFFLDRYACDWIVSR